MGISKGAELTDEVLNEAASARGSRSERNESTPSNAPESNCTAEETPSSGSTSSMPQALLETMVDATGQLSIDERGNCDYCANISGLALVRRIREKCDALLEGSQEDQSSQSPESFQPLTSPVRSPSTSEGCKPRHCLPPRDVAIQYVAAAFNCALTLVRFVHEPSFYAHLDRFYVERSEISSPSSLGDIRFEALLNELFALGVLFSTDSQSEPPANSAAKA